MKNTTWLFQNGQNTSRGGGVIAFALFLCVNISRSAMAQFVIDPVTPDIPAGCISANVQNTGTSAFGDLQVVVVDGNNPSIVFVDYSTSPPTELCFPFHAMSQGATVNDPDVVWDYSGSGLLLVVYESNLSPNGIWSEMWDWNSGAPSPVLAYGTNGLLNFRSGAFYPNVDADVVGNAVVVWEHGGDIEAMTVDFTTLNVSGNICWVNAPNCGINGAIQPDVAIRHFNGDSFVDFVMVDRGRPSGEIKAVFEKFTNVQLGFVTCLVHNISHAGGVNPTNVARPRIDMNTYFNSYWFPYQERFACSIVYELVDGANNYIGSSQLMDITSTSFPLPQPPNPTANIVFEQTYTQPVTLNNEWISDLLNSDLTSTPTGTLNPPVPAGFNSQINWPRQNLNLQQNGGPVTVCGIDMLVYTGWHWGNAGVFPSRPGTVEEILSRRLQLAPNGDFVVLPIPSAINDTRYEFAIPVPTLQEYFAVGEGFSQGMPQTLLSLDASTEFVYYAFVGKFNSRIYYKRSIYDPVAAVRRPRPGIDELFSIGHQSETFACYPNPSSGLVKIETPISIKEIRVIGANGQLIDTYDRLRNTSKVELDLSNLVNGVYTLVIVHETTAPVFHRIVLIK